MTHQLNVLNALPLAAADNLEVRLARDLDEIAEAQRIRYRVFYEELGARPTERIRATGLDSDEFDDVCDHLLVLADGVVVGTYRLIRRDAAARVGHFYSESEFDIAPLLDTDGEILELGRSCVDAQWRHRGTLQLLWQGIGTYIAHHWVRLLFGCGSLAGTDVEILAPALDYLHDIHLAPPELRARARPERAAIPHGTRTNESWEVRRVLPLLPPLLKGYLRLGAFVGDGAVIDEPFNTTDVLIIVKTEAIADRYVRRFV
ncbi:MAG: GNAT family N-acetyltransferase [Alphaproteobacteria bacterium]|nr:GNAT family N-acetyltransferase [Alphaproteobacteria bacterium]